MINHGLKFRHPYLPKCQAYADHSDQSLYIYCLVACQGSSAVWLPCVIVTDFTFCVLSG